MKCTNAKVFRVQPPNGFIDPDGSFKLRLWFKNTSFIVGYRILVLSIYRSHLQTHTRHYFAIHIVNAPDPAVTDPLTLFPKGGKTDGIHHESLSELPYPLRLLPYPRDVQQGNACSDCCWSRHSHVSDAASSVKRDAQCNDPSQITRSDKRGTTKWYRPMLYSMIND